MRAYEVRLTDLARSFAPSGPAALEERVRGEIAELDLEELGDLILHVVTQGGRHFICTPSMISGGGPYLRVDTATYEEQGMVGAGPLAGKALMMPSSDTDDQPVRKGGG